LGTPDKSMAYGFESRFFMFSGNSCRSHTTPIRLSSDLVSSQFIEGISGVRSPRQGLSVQMHHVVRSAARRYSSAFLWVSSHCRSVCSVSTPAFHGFGRLVATRSSVVSRWLG